MTTIPAERLAKVLVEVADTLVDEFDLVEFLHMVSYHATSLVNVAAAGLMLADQDGRLQVMAASDEKTKLLELFQLQAQEGPCLDSFRTGSPVLRPDLTDAEVTWPLFTARAVGEGYRAVYAFPLRLRSEVLGALNLFGTQAGTIAPADIHVVQAVADVATIGLLQERAIRRGEILTEQLQAALNSRIVIEQAKGAVAQQRGITVDEAFEVLRTYARRNRLRLGAVALAALQDPTSIADSTAC
jgi:transcriptional regulator with GAF, ATPase, and Fis domain